MSCLGRDGFFGSAYGSSAALASPTPTPAIAVTAVAPANRVMNERLPIALRLIGFSFHASSTTDPMREHGFEHLIGKTGVLSAFQILCGCRVCSRSADARKPLLACLTLPPF